MKLIFCKQCQDIVRLTNRIRYCKCKNVYGRYVNDSVAIISKNAVPIGILNNSLKAALNKDNKTEDVHFVSFIIAENAPNIIRSDDIRKSAIQFKKFKKNHEDIIQQIGKYYKYEESKSRVDFFRSLKKYPFFKDYLPNKPKTWSKIYGELSVDSPIIKKGETIKIINVSEDYRISITNDLKHKTKYKMKVFIHEIDNLRENP